MQGNSEPGLESPGELPEPGLFEGQHGATGRDLGLPGFGSCGIVLTLVTHSK